MVFELDVRVVKKIQLFIFFSIHLFKYINVQKFPENINSIVSKTLVKKPLNKTETRRQLTWFIKGSHKTLWNVF